MVARAKPAIDAAEDVDPGHAGWAEDARAAAAQASPDLDTRYGRTPGRATRVRLVWWLVAAGFVAVLAAWLVWAGIDGSKVDVRDTAHTVLNEHAVSVSFEVSLPPGESANCAVQALNESFAIVGWKIVQIPASQQRTRVFTEVVRTTQMGVTGLIYRCWPA